MDNKQRSIMNKIKALLEKTTANGATPEEAKAATRMVQVLLSKYNLTIGEVEAQENKDTVEAEGITYNRYWEVALAHTVAHNMCCEGFYNSGNKKYTFIGLEAHRISAISTYEMLKGVCKQGVKTMIQMYGRRKGLENNYAFAFINGVKEAMEAQTTALALVTPEQTKKYTEENYSLRAKTRRIQSSNNEKISEHGYNDGRSAASRKQIK